MKPIDRVRILREDTASWEPHSTRPATVADLVAALIAEGGEKVWLCIDERANGERALWGAALDTPVQIENCWFGGWQKHSPRCGWHLATPIPVESAEAKETS